MWNSDAFVTWYEIPCGNANLLINIVNSLIWWKWKTSKRFSLAINCCFPMSIQFDSLGFYNFTKVKSFKGDAWPQCRGGLKVKDCAESNWKCRGDIGACYIIYVICNLYQIITAIWASIFAEIHIVLNMFDTSVSQVSGFMGNLCVPEKGIPSA